MALEAFNAGVEHRKWSDTPPICEPDYVAGRLPRFAFEVGGPRDPFSTFPIDGSDPTGLARRLQRPDTNYSPRAKQLSGARRCAAGSPHHRDRGLGGSFGLPLTFLPAARHLDRLRRSRLAVGPVGFQDHPRRSVPSLPLRRLARIPSWLGI